MNKLQRLQYANALRDFHKQMRQLVRKGGYGVSGMDAVKTSGDAFEEAVRIMAIDVRRASVEYVKKVMAQKSTYCALFSMPPARRAKSVKTGKPVTLVESRAIAAKKKAAAWDRKAKLAKTKIGIYRRKVSYYKKKGVI
jgi:hypothetical protein